MQAHRSKVPRSRIRAVILDVDGTLIDSVDQHARAWQEAFAAFGHIVPFRAIRSQIGKGGDQLMPTFLSPRAVKQSGKEIAAYRTAVYRIRFLPKTKPFGGVRALCLRLKRTGWKVAIGSSADRKDLLAVLRVLRIERLVDVITSADDARRSKPHPDIFLTVRRKLPGLNPESCIVVGDSPYDAMAAKRAGIRSVGFLCGGSPRAKLTRAGAEKIYLNPSDLLRRYPTSPFNG
jgi:HAD superfamily hydrolase (TIGR01509 family)